MNKQNKIILIGAAAIIILIIGFAFISKSSSESKVATQGAVYEGEMTLDELAKVSSCPLTADKDAFAQCLTAKGFTMYGAYWCPHCQQEKSYFGDSFKYINYVECTEKTQLCLDKGVQGYPTWIVESTSTSASSTATSTN
jgi:hypothetical protein